MLQVGPSLIDDCTPSNFTQITYGFGVGPAIGTDMYRQLLCFRCMQAITADTRLHYPRRPARYIISVVKRTRSEATWWLVLCMRYNVGKYCSELIAYTRQRDRLHSEISNEIRLFRPIKVISKHISYGSRKHRTFNI